MNFRQERKTVMDHLQNCQGCAHEDSCKEIYRCVGNQDAPPVTGKIIRAFVLPLIVFVACVGFMQHSLGSEHPKLTTIIAFAVSLTVTMLFVWLTKLLVRN